MENSLWQHIRSVKEKAPLVHNITNYVVMNNTANALLAAGASPIMSHAHSEIQDMVTICQSLVINIGTLDEYWVESMLKAAKKAKELKKPWVLDPVGAGATPWRNQVLARLLELNPTVIRGNASEIQALAKATDSMIKGVDSSLDSIKVVEAAEKLHRDHHSVVCVSGQTDVIIGPDRKVLLHNGHLLMTKVTGLGCSASALISAFLGATEDPFEATVAAMALFGVCGELAEKQSEGPGSFQVKILDQLYHISEREFLTTLKMSYS